MNDVPAFSAGVILWHDLITSDIDSSLIFYEKLFGWNYLTRNLGAYGDYHLIRGKERPLGGFMKPLIPDTPPHWSLYVSVRDIDEGMKSVESSSGRIAVGPLDIPEIGRFAITLDPEGAAINLFTPFDTKMGIPKPQPGEFCWDECLVNDAVSQKEYYSRLFAWEYRKMNIGNSSYWVALRGEREVAGILKKTEDTPAPPHWLSYILVKNMSQTLSRVESLGGEVLVNETPVPGIGAVAVIQDPSGAVLGIFSPI